MIQNPLRHVKAEERKRETTKNITIMTTTKTMTDDDDDEEEMETWLEHVDASSDKIYISTGFFIL